MSSASSNCASPSLSIASAYDQFSLQIKFEEDWKDNITGTSASMASPSGGTFGSGVSMSNGASTPSISFTQPPLPINGSSPFSNGNMASQQQRIASSPPMVNNGFHGGVENSSLSSSSSFSSSNGNVTSQQQPIASSPPMVNNGFRGGVENSSLSTPSNVGYFCNGNNPFSSNNQASFGSDCHCKTGYTCSKCFQKAMDM